MASRSSSFIVLIVFCFATVVLADDDADTAIVRIKNGPIIGKRRTNYLAFEGIPYAKPPIGKLRFAEPQLNDEQWSEPRNATRFGSVCLQWNHLIPNDDKLDGAEDCLFLNVYTRTTDPEAKQPVIVFIHGGALMFGTGSFYEPDHVMRRPLVLVTFNYRLGPLGFLSTEDDSIPGNYGLKDQVTALEWVQQNIHSFGGDPKRVTIVGYSAGSASVHLHYLSPRSSGLFSHGIGHSGSALNPWVMAERSAEKAKRLSAALGCPTRQTEAMLECLRELPAEDIVRQVAYLLDFLYNPFSPFGAVVEQRTARNSAPFLEHTPRSLMRKGSFTKRPLILSVTEAEGLYPGAEFLSKPEYLEAIDNRWSELMPSVLDYRTSVPEPTKRNQLSDTIRKHYFGSKRVTSDNFKDLIRLISNRLYFTGVTESVKLMQPQIPVYLYFDHYKAKYGVGEALAHRDDAAELLGVAHGDDVLLVFPSILRHLVPFTVEELEVADRFVEMYEAFSKGAKPKFGDYELPVQESPDVISYLKLGYPKSEIKRSKDLSDEAFWQGLDFNDAPYETDSDAKEGKKEQVVLTHSELFNNRHGKAGTISWLLIVTCILQSFASGALVQIENGPIIGERREHFYAFEGLPYAKAPLGELRFAPSEPYSDRWTEPRNATHLGPFCMQWNHLVPGKDKLLGEEDCLYANVYTTSLDESAGLSTIVYIHGGAFMFGGGGFFSPDHLLQKPMVLVTFNYRLGPLGFLSTEDDAMPGNYGLKDQVTLLQWVQRNIRHFGGDPERVTLSGFSAGGASVHLHYLSPMSRGLFQNGIAHSGTALNPWVLAEQSAAKAKRIASALDCVTDRSQTLVDCLRKRPAEDIVRQVPALLDYLYNPFSPLGVVIERQSKLNRKPFLPDHPLVLSRKGKLTKVPLVLSVTQAEGLYPGAEFISNPAYLDDIHEHWNELLPSILDYKTAVQDPQQRYELAVTISERYFGKERQLTPENFDQFVSILSNRLFFAGVTKTAKLLQPHIPVYFYYFNFKADYGLGEMVSGLAGVRNLGVAHGEDTFLLYPSSMRDEHPYSTTELKVVSNLVTMYDTFSRGLAPRYGEEELPVQNVTGKLRFLEIRHPATEVKTAYGVSDEAFWEMLNFNEHPATKSKPVDSHTEL
ncbi:uncharacterized protein LOC126576773 [Anopheles aquasalis]|uniref:uncharacterized protein LOC126576773 n=1 Tax=Anopheles aquasalis TaxID=42839 RepID=UPI00215A51F6|nr:uncharacterized protein LOC126576773 [Anopheles aquasalis]